MERSQCRGPIQKVHKKLPQCTNVAAFGNYGFCFACRPASAATDTSTSTNSPARGSKRKKATKSAYDKFAKCSNPSIRPQVSFLIGAICIESCGVSCHAFTDAVRKIAKIAIFVAPRPSAVPGLSLVFHWAELDETWTGRKLRWRAVSPRVPRPLEQTPSCRFFAKKFGYFSVLLIVPGYYV